MNPLNRAYAAMAAVLIMVVAVAYAYHVTTPMAMAGSSAASSLQNEALNGTSTSTSTGSTAAVATNAVTVANYAFNPAHISIKAGTKVTWTNTDDVDHTITVDHGMGPGSMLFGRNSTYSYTFGKAGTYTYHCMPHPYMHGTVTVTQ